MAIIKRTNTCGISYQVKVRGSDNRWLTKTFASKKEAEDFELAFRSQLSTGSVITSISDKATLDEYFDHWFNNAPHRSSRGWRKTLGYLYSAYVSPYLGKQKLVEITPIMLGEVFGSRLLSQKSEATALHVYILLRRMFSDAIEMYRLMTFNPVLKKLKPIVPEKETKHLSLEQMAKLLHHVKDKPYGVAIWVQFYLGLRAGELQALRWEDVDLDRGIFHIRRTYLNKERDFKPYPKGRKHHSHRIPIELVEFLRELKSQGKVDCEYVATGTKGELMNYYYYHKKLRQYCKELGILIIGTHGLRHSTSELYISHGATGLDLQRLFAHSSLSVTERYIHDKGTNLEKVANVIRLFPRENHVPKIEGCSTHV